MLISSIEVMKLLDWREQQIIELIDNTEIQIFNSYGQEINNIGYELNKHYIVIRHKMLSNAGNNYGLPAYLVDLFSCGDGKKAFEEEVIKLAKINFVRSIYFYRKDIEALKNYFDNKASAIQSNACNSNHQSEMWMEIYAGKLCKEKYLDACYFTSKCWLKNSTAREIIEEIKGVTSGKLKTQKEKNSVKFTANRYRELAAEFLGRHREEFPRLALPPTWKTQLNKLK